MNTEVAFDQQEFLNLGIARSQKFHVLKFRSVMGRLTQYEDEGFFKSSNPNFLSVINSLKSTQLLEYGSDFFWSSIHRVFNAFDAGNEMTEIMYGIFLQNAFDSFFQLLPIWSRLEFKNYGDDQITFIRLGVSIEKFLDWPVILEKTEDKSLAYGYAYNTDRLEGPMVTINLEAIPNYHSIKLDIIAGTIKVLYQRHQVLFEHVYHYECNDSVYLGKLFYPRLVKAFSIIKDADESLYHRITDNLDYIVPLAKPGKSNHPSFASALLKRTIFLSLDLLETGDHYLAECIIHEFSHCQLYRVQDTILLTNVDLSKRYYYSPWRIDPRHLLGLVHGIYVFSCVIKFYRELLTKPKPETQIKVWVQNRVVLLVGQVLCAIRQVREDEIAQAGALLLESISGEISEIAREMDIDLVIVHLEILEHQQAWKLKNTDSDFVIR
jgi:hypothetical protein